MESKNIYQKLADLKLFISKANISKTGYNPYINFKYYELNDFLPIVISEMQKLGLVSYVTFTENFAFLRLTDTDKPEQFIEISSPLVQAQIKACNEIQNLGGAQTYLRRYLYFSLLDLCENDISDKTLNTDMKSNGSNNTNINKQNTTNIPSKLRDKEYVEDGNPGNCTHCNGKMYLSKFMDKNEHYYYCSSCKSRKYIKELNQLSIDDEDKEIIPIDVYDPC